MYKQHCILTLNQDTHLPAARHMQIESLYGTNSYPGPKEDARQTRCRSRCMLAPPCSSNAPPRQLSEDVRKFPARPRIETHDGGEQIRWRIRHTLAGTWHWKQRRRQRSMPPLMLQNCSTCWYHRAPALRHTAVAGTDESLQLLPPPCFRRLAPPVPSTRCCT